MSKDIDKAAEMVTSLTIDLSKALDNLETEKIARVLLCRRCSEHITTIETKCAEIRNLRKRIERLERENFVATKADKN